MSEKTILTLALVFFIVLIFIGGFSAVREIRKCEKECGRNGYIIVRPCVCDDKGY